MTLAERRQLLLRTADVGGGCILRRELQLTVANASWQLAAQRPIRMATVGMLQRTRPLVACSALQRQLPMAVGRAGPMEALGVLLIVDWAQRLPLMESRHRAKR